MSRPELAAAIGVTVGAVIAFEDGHPAPASVLTAVRALEPGRSAEHDMGRDRWVTAVRHLARYVHDHVDIRRLHADEMADVLDLAARGPHPETARTDPARYGMLRAAARKMFADGHLMVDHLPEWCAV
jgi:hypothetical protein